MKSSPETCPNCGADVPPGARACPECGSCEETGWSEEAAIGGLGLPDDEFDHADYVKREFGDGQSAPAGISPLWWVVGIIVLILLGILALRAV